MSESKKSGSLTVLITGSGAPGVYGVIKGLRKVRGRSIRLVGVDIDPDAASRYMLDAFHIVPPRTSSAFLPAVREIADREKADVILPIPTAELELFSHHRSFFPDHLLMVSPADQLRIANNKDLLYGYLKGLNFSCVPIYRTVSSIDELVKAIKDLGYPQKRVCLRKPVGTGAQGFRILDAKADRLDILLNSNPDATTTTIEEILFILKKAPVFPELIVQEYLPGDEYDVDILCENGSCHVILPRRNERMLWGMSLVSIFVNNQEIINLSKKILKKLKLSYIVSLTFKYSNSGNPMILEINPRVPASVSAALGLSVNLPAMALKLILNESFQLPAIQWNVKMLRFWDEVMIRPEESTGGRTKDHINQTIA